MTEQFTDYKLNYLLELLGGWDLTDHIPDKQTLTGLNNLFEDISEKGKKEIVLTLLQKTTDKNNLLTKFLLFETLAISHKINLLLNSLPKSANIFPIEKYSVVFQDNSSTTIYDDSFHESTRKSTILVAIAQAFYKVIAGVRNEKHKQAYTQLLNSAITCTRSTLEHLEET